MKQVPFLAKFAISSLISFTMCAKLYEKHVYEPEIYRIAVKYRPQFDKEYQKQLQGEPLF